MKPGEEEAHGLVELVEGVVCRERTGEWDDHEDLQDVREDLYPPGGGAALAGPLPGVPGEASAGGDDQAEVPPLRKGIHLLIVRRALAEILPGMPGKALSA